MKTVKWCTLGKLAEKNNKTQICSAETWCEEWHCRSREHSMDWDSKHVNEALYICQQASLMNLDCGLHINPIWNPILDHPSPPETTYPLSSPDYPWLLPASSCLFFLFQFFDSIIIIISLYVKRHTVLVIPLMKILRSKCLDLSTEVHSCAT